MMKKSQKKFGILAISIFSLSTFCMFINNGPVFGVSAPKLKIQRLSVPIEPKDVTLADSSAEQEDKIDSTILKTEEEFFTVQKGQTLWEISQVTETSVADLMKRNHLANSIVFEGQYLIVNQPA